jgi:hypothetical protein
MAGARQQAGGWLRSVLTAAAASPELAEFLRDIAREAAQTSLPGEEA